MSDNPMLLLGFQIRHAIHIGVHLFFIGGIVFQRTTQGDPGFGKFELDGFQINFQGGLQRDELYFLFLR